MQKQKERERKKNKKLYIVAYKPKDLNSSSHKKGHADNEHSGKAGRSELYNTLSLFTVDTNMLPSKHIKKESHKSSH